MKSKQYEGNILDAIEFVYECGKNNNKVIFSGIKNAPTERSMYYIFFKNGVKDCYQTWSQFIEVLYDKGSEHVELNLTKIKDSLGVYLPHIVSRDVVVEYFGDDVVKESGVVMGSSLTYSDCVSAKKSMNAVNFKLYVNAKVKECDIDYEVDLEKGVNKMMKELKEILK